MKSRIYRRNALKLVIELADLSDANLECERSNKANRDEESRGIPKTD